MPSAAELFVRISGDSRGGVKALQQVGGAAAAMPSFFNRALSSAVGLFSGLAAFNVVSAGLSAAGDAAIGMNSRLEQSQVAFGVMLGSGTAANKMLGDLQQFALSTPFEFPQLVSASQRLLAMGFASQQVLPLLEDVGNAAAASPQGMTQAIDKITLALGQMQAKGKVQGDELLQLTEAGIPALQLLAASMGKTTAATSKLVSAGKVTAPTFIKAFQAFSKAKFGGLMAAQSQTFEGAMSNIRDSLSQSAAQAFFPFFDLLRDGVRNVAAFLQTKDWTAFVGRVRSGVASLVQPIGTFAVMVGNVAKAHGLNLLQAALVATNIIIGQTFGPAASKTFNDWLAIVQNLGSWVKTNLPLAFAWLGANLPGLVEQGAVKFQEFLGWLQTNGPTMVDGVIKKFEEWRDWLLVEIPKMVGTVKTNLAALVAAATRSVQQLQLTLAEAITSFATLPIASFVPALTETAKALEPQIAALRKQLGIGEVARASRQAQERRLPAGLPTGTAFLAGQGITFNGPVVAFNGDVNAHDPAEVDRLADTVAQTLLDLVGSAAQADAGPSVNLVGALP